MKKDAFAQVRSTKKPRKKAPDFSAFDRAAFVRLGPCPCGTKLVNNVAAMRRAGFMPSEVASLLHEKYLKEAKICDALRLFARLIWKDGNAPYSLISVEPAGRA